MLMKMVSVGCGTTVIAFGTGLIFAPEQELKCIRTPTGFLVTLCHSLLIMAELSPAAALRAAADQVIPMEKEPTEPPGHGIGYEPAEYVRDWTCWHIRRQLLAIADELEGTTANQED
jgi:hypothetical protein